MRRYNVDHVTKVKDCEYARIFEVVGHPVKILKHDDEHDYHVEFINCANKYGSTRDYFMDYELE